MFTAALCHMILEILLLVIMQLVLSLLSSSLKTCLQFVLADHKGSLITTNYKRVVEVWFDEKQKKYFYAREPTAK